MIDALTWAAAQIAVVVLIAAAVYGLFGKQDGFRRYIGLIPTSTAISRTTVFWGIAPALVLIAIPGVRTIAGGDHSALGVIAGDSLTASGVLMLAVKALVQTSLSEELLFRGLIGKRLIAHFGFAVGNRAQAAVFGLAHLSLLFIPQMNLLPVLAVVVITGGMGWVYGWLDEWLGHGSIFPGWTAHGLTNLVAYLTVTYLG